MKALLSLFVFALGLAAQAQPTTKAFRVGVVFNSVPPQELSGPIPSNGTAKAFMEGLQGLGWRVGQDVEILWRTGQSQPLPALIDELVGVPVDILVVNSDGMARLAMSKTRTIPIVMATSGAPVQRGIVKSLARPGGNVTGLTHAVGRDLEGKRLSLLKEAVPAVTRVAYLSPAGHLETDFPRELTAAANALGISLSWAWFDADDRVEAAIDAAIRKGANGMIVADASMLNQQPARKVVQQAAVRHRLPMIYCAPAGVASNEDLIGFGIGDEEYKRAAYYVHRILKGANPAEMPIEQPTAVRLTISLSAARAIGLTIPPSVLLQADRVFE